MAEGGDSKRIFLITARHVVFPLNPAGNNMYEHENPSQPHRNVLHFGPGAFKKLLASIRWEIGNAANNVERQEKRLEAVEGVEGEEERERKDAQDALDQAKNVIKVHPPYFQEVLEHWGTAEDRTLGHVLMSLPSGSMPVSINIQRISPSSTSIPPRSTQKIFKGNVIDLETKLTTVDLDRMMNPRPTDPKNFKHPLDRLLPLQGTISTAELRRPTTVDKDGESCFMVLKRGNATDLTIGRGNNTFSFVRHYFKDKEPQTSKEWPVLPYDRKYGAFSSQGDSGAVVVDGRGRIGGLIIIGSGDTDDLDITYATPIEFLMERITKQFPNAHPHPVLSATT